MAQRRFHYEQAFEHYLRSNRAPYVAVDESRKALLPEVVPGTKGSLVEVGAGAARSGGAIKSFDFVVYGANRNLLVDVKGRMFGRAGASAPRGGVGPRRFESWVTEEDLESLEQWQRLFGPDFQAIFVFTYCLRQQPPDALFEELFAFGDRWYALREVAVADYAREAVTRSARWRTVHVPREAFNRISGPFSIRPPQTACEGPPGVIS